MNNSTKTTTTSCVLSSQTKISLLKKFILRAAGVFSLFLFLGGSVWGQNVSTYSFAESTGSYTAITGGTTAIGASVDDGVGALINIGFNFTYHGVVFTQFAAGSNGYIRLGAATSTTFPSSTSNTIMFMGGDGATGATAPTYLLSGTSPNRVLTIQFPTQWVHYSASTNLIEAQIKLFETTNVVQIIYGSSARATAYTRSVGLVGGATTDYSTRVTSFASSTAGSSNSSTMPWSTTVYPSSGLTYTWTPPAPPACAAPSALTSSNITSTSATISWTAASPAPTSGYEYFYSTSSTAPTAGTTPSGTTAAGVVTANITGLTANTTYYYWVRSNCGGSGTSTWEGSSTFFTGYCTPSSSSVDDTGITNVTFGTGPTVNNTTVAEANNYGNYSAQIGGLAQSSSATISMTFNTDTYPYTTGIYVDWNNNLDFADAGELVWSGVSGAVSPNTLVATFTVPGSAVIGANYRMRIGSDDSGVVPAACATGLTYACFEDYTVTVVAPPSCVAPSALTSSNITSTSATISWTAASPAPTSGYEYFYSTSSTAPTAGTTPSGTTAAGVITANITGLTANTTYYFWVRSNCDGSGTSTWAGSSTFLTGICIPTGTSTIYYYYNYYDNYISNVTTTGGGTNIVNTSASNTGYGDYTAQSASNSIGTATDFSVSHSNQGSGIGVWINWNNDLDFADANEQIAMTTGWSSSTFTGTINIPVGTPVGSYRMRIVLDYNSQSPISCPVNIEGETEDYTFIVAAANTAAAASSTPTLCISTALTNITHTTTGATGIGSASGLPAGVTAAWASNTITISGTPSASGTFNYTIPLSGGYGSVNATGTITVTAAPNAGTISGTQAICSNGTSTFASSGNSGGTWTSGSTNYATIDGTTGVITPVAAGTSTITYTVTGTGGCSNATATRTITVNGFPFWGNLQWPALGYICPSGTFDVYGQVYEALVTPGAGAGTGIVAQFGYSTSNTNPNTWTTWSSASYQGESGNNDEYKGTFSGLSSGTYYYAFRYALNNSTCYVYGGSGGFWSGSNVSGVLTVNPCLSTWTGGTSTDWSNASNWNPAVVPTSTDNVVIPTTGITNFPVATSVTIDAGATVTVQSGARLTVNGTLTNNGTLTIESGATLVQGASSTLAGTGGTYNVKQAVTGATDGTNPNGRFWYIGSPVALSSSSVLFFGANDVVKKRDEPNNTWTALTSGSENLAVGRGYYMRTTQSTPTINFTGGAINNHPTTAAGLTLNLSRTTGQGFEGFNLVSNPYPSYLDWDLVTKDQVENTMWYRTADGNNSMVFETYVALSGGIGTSNSGNTATKLIPPMQSFWVRVASTYASGNITLNNSMRSHFASFGSSTAGLRSTVNDFNLFLRMNLLQEDKKDQIIVYVNENSSNQYDAFDGEKMMQVDRPQFYTTASGKKIVINGLSAEDTQQSLPITMELTTTGTHQFMVEDLEIAAGNVWLEDKLKETYQLLEPGFGYKFFAYAGLTDDRFVLHLKLKDANSPSTPNFDAANEMASNHANVYSEGAGVVVIKLPTTDDVATDVQIYDASGRIFFTGTIKSLESKIQLEQAKGIYYVSLTSVNGVEVRKVFIH